MTQVFSHLLLVGIVLRAAVADTFVGFVVDNFCWNMPGHRGIDGSRLGTHPGSHTLHCFWEVPPCRESGYVLLEELPSATPEGYTYGPRHQLDGTGDGLMYRLAFDEQRRAGDRRFNDHVTITGTLAGNEIAVTKVCITPAHRNRNRETFCQCKGSCEVDSTTSAPAATTAPVTSTAFLASTTSETPADTTSPEAPDATTSETEADTTSS